MTLQWHHPFAAMLSGCSGAGKTSFTKRFLRERDSICDTHFDRIILYYSEWQSAYTSDFESVEFREGLPQLKDFDDTNKKKLIIMDDLMRESSSSGAVVDIFTRGSHHKNLSVLFLTQNLFFKGLRDISLNSSYLVIFKNPRDRSQISYLARQVYPEDPGFIQSAYFDATSEAYGYLLLDLKQDTPEKLRVRTCIFPSDPFHYVYIPKKPRDINRPAADSDIPVMRL